MTYYSTLAGDLAHARPKSVSLFTEATLRALRGAGSDNPNDEWWVNTSRLHEAVDHFMKEPVFAGKVAGVQIPAVNAMPVFAVHRLTGPPIVPVYVGCVPQEANGTAEFICRQGDAEKSRRAVGDLNPADPTGRWLLDLALGEYEFEARLAPDDVRVRSKRNPARLPHRRPGEDAMTGRLYVRLECGYSGDVAKGCSPHWWAMCTRSPRAIRRCVRSRCRSGGTRRRHSSTCRQGVTSLSQPASGQILSEDVEVRDGEDVTVQLELSESPYRKSHAAIRRRQHRVLGHLPRRGELPGAEVARVARVHAARSEIR